MLYALMTTMKAGEMLDHYRLEATVAHSGMSTLYRATDMRDGRQVAVKIPHAEMESDPILLERFKREQEIGQELDHPGIVKTFDGEERSRLYMVIEWVDGQAAADDPESRRAGCPSTGRSTSRWRSAMRSTTCTSTAWCTAT